jgi:hypothetical protein
MPAPMQAPWISAMVGTGIASSAAEAASTAASYRFGPSVPDRASLNSLRSAPDTKARSPWPRTTTACSSPGFMSRSPARCSAIATHMP